MELLRDSVENGFKGFSLCYQPQVEAATGCVVGAEALARWRLSLIHIWSSTWRKTTSRSSSLRSKRTRASPSAASRSSPWTMPARSIGSRCNGACFCAARSYNRGEPQGALTPHGSRIASAVWLLFLRLLVLADREPLHYCGQKTQQAGSELKGVSREAFVPPAAERWRLPIENSLRR